MLADRHGPVFLALNADLALPRVLLDGEIVLPGEPIQEVVLAALLALGPAPPRSGRVLLRLIKILLVRKALDVQPIRLLEGVD